MPERITPARTWPVAAPGWYRCSTKRSAAYVAQCVQHTSAGGCERRAYVHVHVLCCAIHRLLDAARKYICCCHMSICDVLYMKQLAGAERALFPLSLFFSVAIYPY